MQHNVMARGDLLSAANLEDSGTARNYLGRLRRCGLIEMENGSVQVSPDIKELMQ